MFVPKSEAYNIKINPKSKIQNPKSRIAMQNNSQSFLQSLDDIIKKNSMLDHPFYQTWNMGKLTREALCEYAKQYYHFVQAFPTFLSATHANTPHLSVRQDLLENLIEE